MITNFQRRQVGEYSVEVSNALGSVLSAGAILHGPGEVLPSFGFPQEYADNTFRGTLFTHHNQTFQIQSSSNLIDWVLFRSLIGGSNRFEFPDPGGKNSRAFFRAVADYRLVPGP